MTACSSCPTKEDIEVQNKLNNKIDSLTALTEKQSKTIDSLRDSVFILSYPANQRLQDIKTLVQSDDLTVAKKKIAELKKTFPKSTEANECADIESIIKQREDAIKAEQDRIKALGFKGIEQKMAFQIGYNSISLSGFSFSTQFVHDNVGGGGYAYDTADRGNKFITASMTVTSKNKNPKIPEFAIYSIEGDKMIYEGVFDPKFARWADYGAYLGNYSDSANDFSKVSTVRFKIGVEVSKQVASKAFAVVCKNENVLYKYYNRLNEPPVSYIGTANNPRVLKIKDFEKEYILVKLFNL